MQYLDIHPARLQRVVHVARYVAEPGNLVGEPSVPTSASAFNTFAVPMVFLDYSNTWNRNTFEEQYVYFRQL